MIIAIFEIDKGRVGGVEMMSFIFIYIHIPPREGREDQKKIACTQILSLFREDRKNILKWMYLIYIRMVEHF